MANKKRRCSHCKTYKIADDGIVIKNTFFCDFSCATTKALNGIDKGKKIIQRENKKAVIELYKKTIKWQHKQTQPSFNKLRKLQELKWFSDRSLEPVCISCQKPIGNDIWCNGHFKSVGANGRLRYDFMNSYLQHNRSCNMAKSGDIEGYKKGLLARFGDKRGLFIIEYCEMNNSPMKLSWQDIEKMRKEFNFEIKKLSS